MKAGLFRTSSAGVVLLAWLGLAACGCTRGATQADCESSAAGPADTLRVLPPLPDLPLYLAGFGEEDVLSPPDTLEAIGVGSLPARMYGDGSICLLDPSRPGDRGQLLFRLPDSLQAVRRRALAFLLDGVFDLDRCGSPEVFVEYAGEDGELSGVTFLVFKKKGDSYVLDLETGARSEGYAPAAWFLDDSPKRKAIFMTRADGSSGAGLFCLEAGQESLQDILGELTDYPDFVDLDQDGRMEICAPYFHGSGDDCWSLWRLQRGEYVRWWPDRGAGPFLIDATVADIDGRGCGAIVAVVMPKDASDRDGPAWNDVRYLTVWRLRSGEWQQVASTRLPDCEEPQYPEVTAVRRADGEVTITLGHGDAPARRYAFRRDALVSVPD